MHGARIGFLAQCLLALLKVRSISLAELATGLGGPGPDGLALPASTPLLPLIRVRPRPLVGLLVRRVSAGDGPWRRTPDRTHGTFGRVDINFLVLGIAYCGIAPPIFWSVLNKVGQSNTAERIALMKRCLVVFGVGRIAVLRADREFGGEAGFRWRQAQPIPFHQRRKCDTLILNHWNRRTRVDALLAALKPGSACLLPGRRSV